MSKLKDIRTEIHNLLLGKRPKSKDVMDKVDELVKQACKEQRQNCLQSLLTGYIGNKKKFSSVGTESWRSLNQKQIANIILDESNKPTYDKTK